MQQLPPPGHISMQRTVPSQLFQDASLLKTKDLQPLH